MAGPNDCFLLVEWDKRYGYMVVDSNYNISIRKSGEHAKWWGLFGHDLNIVFQHGRLAPGLYSECVICNLNHVEAVEEFMDWYAETRDGANIHRSSELDRRVWKERGYNTEEPDLVAAYQRGEISLEELGEGLRQSEPTEWATPGQTTHRGAMTIGSAGELSHDKRTRRRRPKVVDDAAAIAARIEALDRDSTLEDESLVDFGIKEETVASDETDETDEPYQVPQPSLLDGVLKPDAVSPTNTGSVLTTPILGTFPFVPAMTPAEMEESLTEPALEGV